MSKVASRKLRFWGGGVVLVVLLALGLVGLTSTPRASASDQPAVVQGPTDEEVARIESISNVFRKVAQKVTPAVVRVNVTAGFKKTEKGEKEESDEPKTPGLPEELRKFFKDHGFGIPEMPRQWKNMPRVGMGSGVIIDARNGYVLTNNHVVDGADPAEVEVTTYDHRRLKPEWIRTDEMSDVAILKLKNPGGLAELKLGDSDKVQVGDWVLAVGSPFGARLSNTVTFGIISAKGREMEGLSIDYQNFLQTDAAINPGNSGGPLVNFRGDMIGLNTAIASTTAQYAGVGFALPSNMVKWVVTQLIEHTKVARGYLGVQIQNLEDQPGLAKSFGLTTSKGVVITEVMGAPARKAGLKAGDVVLGIDGKDIATTTDLSSRVAMIRPGTKAKFHIWRDNKAQDIEVTIGQQPKGFHTRMGPNVPKEGESEEETAGKIDTLGITVAPLTETNGKKFGWKGDEGGLLIAAVEPGSEASNLGLQPGDLIVQVQGKPVKSVEEFRHETTKEDLAKGVRLMVKSPRTGTHYLFLQNR
jgi:serine protease Do